MSETEKFDVRRRGERALIRVPIEVSGTTVDGTPLEEQAHTGVIGALGAMIRTSRMLQMGTEVTVTNPFSHQTATFRVVWVNDEKSSNLWDIGIESLQPLDDFWGVRFPSKRDLH